MRWYFLSKCLRVNSKMKKKISQDFAQAVSLFAILNGPLRPTLICRHFVPKHMVALYTWRLTRACYGSKNDLVSPSAFFAPWKNKKKKNRKHPAWHVKSNTCHARYLSGIRLTSKSLTETHILQGYICVRQS